jgi:hypothetical protein
MHVIPHWSLHGFHDIGWRRGVLRSGADRKQPLSDSMRVAG